MYIKTHIYKQFDSIEVKESLFNEFDLPNHFHHTYCIGLLSSGIKKSIIEGTPQLVYANSTSIVNPYQVHSDRNIDNDDCHFKMIYVNKDVVNYMANKITGKSNNNVLFTNDLITNPLVSFAISNFFNEMQDESLVENKLKKLIELLLSGSYTKNNIVITNESKNAIDDSIEKAQLNFLDKIDISKMSHESKLSKYQFIRYFKKRTGLTPASYILLHRINFAKSLLIEGMPIGQVALESGFYDHAQFCKFFKYYTNIAPIEYKRNCNIIQA
jgi:AraC-like DNA-binding protein